MLDRGGYLICETARCFKRPSRRLSAKLEQRLRAREAAASAHADAPILIAARKCRMNPEPSATSSLGLECPMPRHEPFTDDQHKRQHLRLRILQAARWTRRAESLCCRAQGEKLMGMTSSENASPAQPGDGDERHSLAGGFRHLRHQSHETFRSELGELPAVET